MPSLLPGPPLHMCWVLQCRLNRSIGTGRLALNSVVPSKLLPWADQWGRLSPSLPLEPLHQHRQVGLELGGPQQAALPARVPGGREDAVAAKHSVGGWVSRWVGG